MANKERENSNLIWYCLNELVGNDLFNGYKIYNQVNSISSYTKIYEICNETYFPVLNKCTCGQKNCVHMIAVYFYKINNEINS